MNLKLVNSAPFRFAIAFAFLYLVCFSIGSCVYYMNIERAMSNGIDQSLMHRRNALKDVYNLEGTEGVIRVIERRSSMPMQVNMGYQFRSQDGEYLAGNFETDLMPPGLHNFDGDEIGMDSEDHFRFFTAPLGEHTLSLGRSIRELNELRKRSIEGYLLIFFATSLLAVVGGVVLASRTHTRIRSIVNSMDNIADGNLSARLPVSSRHDDLDKVSAKTNEILVLLQQQIVGMKNISSNIAHDLKTPLNRLHMKVEEAAEAIDSNHPAQRLLDDAMIELSGIDNTFETLLHISQIQASARKSKLSLLKLKPILETLIEIYRPVAEDKGQSLELRLDNLVESNAVLQVLGDKELLFKLIINLIENSIRHCQVGTAIVVSAGANSESVWLSICDNGPGIPENQRKDVFQQLYRLESSRTSPGAGLGLSMVKAITKLHNASVTLSDNNPGLCVTIMFDQYQRNQ